MGFNSGFKGLISKLTLGVPASKRKLCCQTNKWKKVIWWPITE